MTRLLLNAIILGSTSLSYAQCGATSVTPSLEFTGQCFGIPDTISFTATGACTGVFEYQIEGPGSVVLQAWSINSDFIALPSVTTDYTVYARCSACPTTVVSSNFSIEVIPSAIIVADSVICSGNSATLFATGPFGSMSWWDNPGGNALSPNETYFTPPLTQNETYYLEVAGQYSNNTNQAGLLISECGLHGFPGQSSADYLEISNLYTTDLNTAGWVVAVSNSYTNINSVSTTMWQLPALFPSCSMQAKTDVMGDPNYFGANIFWNPNNNGWALILDDQGNVIDFVCWGWTQNDLATFNTNINGFQVTLSSDWTGNGCPATCTSINGTMNSISRIGNTDTNSSADFVCQETSIYTLNPELDCGWVREPVACYYPFHVYIDQAPTASNPANLMYDCYDSVPAPAPSVVMNVQDDFTANPYVQFVSETSNGLICPEIITRTYGISDSCSNYIEVTQQIIVYDSIPPVLSSAPNDTIVNSTANVPIMNPLNWTDNCLGSGTIMGVEVSSGTTNPELLTRTWLITDSCGNSATETQIITIDPTLSLLEQGNSIFNPTVSPNPTTALINVDLGPQTYTDIEIQTLNALGQLISTNSFANTESVELSINAAPGVYFLLVEADGNTTVLRIVKE